MHQKDGKSAIFANFKSCSVGDIITTLNTSRRAARETDRCSWAQCQMVYKISVVRVICWGQLSVTGSVESGHLTGVGNVMLHGIGRSQYDL